MDEESHKLMALLAHEMRSPGAVVAGYLRMLKGTSPAETSARDAREQKMIEEANRSCARLLHIVQELSDFDELSSPHPDMKLTPVPIFALCDDVVQENEGGDVTFVCDDADRDVMVEGHAGRLKQAVSAVMASIVRERGSAPVEAHGFVHRNATSQVLIAFADPGAVTNAGEVLKHQRTPFNRWRGGMGLSLPIAHRIVEVHGGAIWGLPESRAACALSFPLPPA